MRLIGIRVLRDYLEVSCAFALRVLPYFFPSRFTIMLFYGGGSALRALLCQLWRFAPSEIIQFSSVQKLGFLAPIGIPKARLLAKAG